MIFVLDSLGARRVGPLLARGSPVRRPLIVAVLLSLATGRVIAAPISVGPRVGSSIPNLRNSGGNEISSGYSSRVAPYFGVFCAFELKPWLSLQPEVDYAPQGGKRDGMQPVTGETGLPLPPGTRLYANFESVAKLNYLEIPILLKFHLGNHRRFFVDIGPHVGILLSAENVTSGTSQLYFDSGGQQPVSDGTGAPLPPQNFAATTDAKDELRSTSWGFQGGLGIVQPLARGELFLEGRGGIGLTSIQKDTATNGDNSTGVLVFTLGYAVRLAGRP
jgi:hypothetical protein